MEDDYVEKPRPVRDAIDVPTHLVDGIRGMSVQDGIVSLNMTRMTFGTPDGDLQGTFENTVFRMALPLPAFVRVALYLEKQLKALEEDGGSTAGTETKNYPDSKVDAVKAQNDARFAEVLARFDVLKSDIDSKPTPPSIWQIAGVVAAGIGALVAIAAFAYDRFDGGIAAGALVDQVVSQIEETQAKRDQAQDQRLNQILEAIVGANDQSQGSATEGQD